MPKKRELKDLKEKFEKKFMIDREWLGSDSDARLIWSFIETALKAKEKKVKDRVFRLIDEYIWGIEDDNVIKYFKRLREDLLTHGKKTK